jgi:hypothetical protein
MENLMVWTYAVYLLLSLGLTVFVARTLHKNGRIFLVESFNGNEKLADSVNHLLVVGFYLINIGFVSLALKYGTPAYTLEKAIEYLSQKVGIVALVLGGMHFVNLLIFSKMRKRATEPAEARSRWNRIPEVVPAEHSRR